MPSSTISTVGRTQAAGGQTQFHARALRGLLESLDDVRHSRGELVFRAQRRGGVDDIRPRIMTASGKFDRDAEITPAMFIDVSDEELAKYDRFIQGLVEGQMKQEGLLEAIKVRLITSSFPPRVTSRSSLRTRNSYPPGRKTLPSKSVNKRCRISTSPMRNIAKLREI